MQDENIERQLGVLLERTDTIGRNIKSLWDMMNEKIVPTISDVKDHGKRLDKIEPHVEDWKRTKQRGIGLLFASGVGGAGILEAIKRIIGH